jgi:hypothetical protein
MNFKRNLSLLCLLFSFITSRPKKNCFSDDRCPIEFQRTFLLVGEAVAPLVEALHYKPEGRGLDSQLCHWNFSST